VRVWLASLVLLGCDVSYHAVEPLESHDVRVVVSIAGADVRVEALAGDVPYRFDLAPHFDREDPVEIWIFAYTIAELAETMPLLADMSATQVAAALDPRFTSGSGVPLPTANQVLRTSLRRGEEGTAYRLGSWSDWTEAALDRELGRLSAHPPNDGGFVDCGSLELRRIESPIPANLSRAIALDDSTYLVSGQPPGAGSSDPTLFVEVRRSGATVRPTRAAVRDQPAGLAHRTDGTIAVASSPLNRIFTVTSTGGAAPELYVPRGADVKSIVSGGDGAVVLFGPAGVWIERGPDFELAGGLDRAVWAAARDASQIAAYDGQAIWFWSDAQWRNEYRLTFPESISRMAGDADVMVAVGSHELVLVRDPETGAWHTLPRPWDAGHHLRGVAGLGGGDFITVGKNGAVAVRRSGRWCTANTGTLDGLWDVAVSPGRQSALAVGRPPPDIGGPTPALYWVDL